MTGPLDGPTAFAGRADCGCLLGHAHNPDCSYMKDWREKQPESYARLQKAQSMSALTDAPLPQLCRHCGYAKQAHARGFCPAPDPGESRSAFSKYEARVTAGQIPKAEDDPATIPMVTGKEPRRDDVFAAWLKEKRDRYTQDEPNDFWQAIDDLLDDYRLHADTGTPLTEPTPHPNPDY